MGEICSAHKKQITAQLANSVMKHACNMLLRHMVLTLPVEKIDWKNVLY